MIHAIFYQSTKDCFLIQILYLIFGVSMINYLKLFERILIFSCRLQISIFEKFINFQEFKLYPVIHLFMKN